MDYEERMRHLERLGDWDLIYAMEHNPQSFGVDQIESVLATVVDQIESVLATVEGERDESAWTWILKLTGNRFALMIGGCDYSGWDCQSWLRSEIVLSLEDALDLMATPRWEIYRHSANGDISTVYAQDELRRQLEEGRHISKREVVAQRIWGSKQL